MKLLRQLVDFFRFRKFSKNPQDRLNELSKRLQYQFINQNLLFQALKHRSYLTCTGEKRIESNERLELLGDSVLGMTVTEFLYNRFPDEEEGILTNYKSLLVNRTVLSQVAKDFGLGKFLLLNESEERSGGRKRESILSDGVEAIIGAIYLDGGLENARNFVHLHIAKRLDEIIKKGQLKNYKSLLQEHCQSCNLRGPKYIIEEENGPDHLKEFTVAVIIDGKRLGSGHGHSKKDAEQKAARESLQQLNVI
ncbi:MAG TPA: ribonuclease III [bacterium]|nr:ribonuclease III [bacterium]HPN42213.1 ribonuclease III [bacterium]